MSQGQTLTVEELKQELKLKSKQKIVFTNGCFDILHPGHVKYLAEAKALGDILVVGLDDDISVKKNKGNSRPYLNQEQRAYMLCALRSVDFVCLYGGYNPEPLIREVNPQILVKGGDYDPDTILGAKYVKSIGGEVRCLSFTEGFSTTNLVEKIKSN